MTGKKNVDAYPPDAFAAMAVPDWDVLDAKHYTEDLRHACHAGLNARQGSSHGRISRSL